MFPRVPKNIGAMAADSVLKSAFMCCLIFLGAAQTGLYQ